MKVSVAMITYDHAAFVAEAIEGVLAQDVDFDYELVIGDDCSTDETSDIVADYARRHPDVIRATTNETNLGANANWVATMRRCRGEYLALLDGDDHWTSPDKLRLQAAHLDATPRCVLAFHPVEILHRDGHRTVWQPPGRRLRYGLDDLLRGNFIATASVMVRTGLGVEFPLWYDEARGMPGDWLLFCLHARHGSLDNLGRVMSVYRHHDAGIWSASGRERVRRLKALVEICHHLEDDLGPEHAASIHRAVLTLRLKILTARLAPVAVEPLAAAGARLNRMRR